jgi:hypothetical protein
VESAESDARDDAASDQEAPSERPLPNDIPELPCFFNYKSELPCIFLTLFLVSGVIWLLLLGIGIVLGLLFAQPLPFLHPLARLAYALLAIWSVAVLLLFTWSPVLLPHSALGIYYAELRHARLERFRGFWWRRIVGSCTNLLSTADLVVLAVAPVWLVERWPVWSLPPLAQGLLNTAIFLGITALLGLIAWLPNWLLSPPDLRKITGRQQTIS